MLRPLPVASALDRPATDDAPRPDPWDPLPTELRGEDKEAPIGEARFESWAGGRTAWLDVELA